MSVGKKDPRTEVLPSKLQNPEKHDSTALLSEIEANGSPRIDKKDNIMGMTVESMFQTKSTVQELRKLQIRSPEKVKGLPKLHLQNSEVPIKMRSSQVLHSLRP